MKRTFFLLTVVVLALAATASSASGYTAYIYGYALQDNGSRCGNDCLALVYSRNSGITRSGAVSNGTASCAGHTYNFGAPSTNGCININPSGTFFGTGTASTPFDVWIRHDCPSGFYYSPQKSYYPTYEFQVFWGGTFQLHKPAGGCFAARPTLGVRLTPLAIAAGLGA